MYFIDAEGLDVKIVEQLIPHTSKETIFIFEVDTHDNFLEFDSLIKKYQNQDWFYL